MIDRRNHDDVRLRGVEEVSVCQIHIEFVEFVQKQTDDSDREREIDDLRDSHVDVANDSIQRIRLLVVLRRSIQIDIDARFDGERDQKDGDANVEHAVCGRRRRVLGVLERVL